MHILTQDKFIVNYNRFLLGNYFTPNQGLIEKYADKIAVTHVHDNFGNADSHLNLGEGNTDIKSLEKRLVKCSPNLALSAEVKFKDNNTPIDELLDYVYGGLEKLGKIIDKTRQKVQSCM